MTMLMQKPTLSQFALSALTLVSLMTLGLNAQAAESFKFRQSSVGAFGGEMAAPADNPGFFATAGLAKITIDKIAGPTGDDVTPADLGKAVAPIVLNPAVPYRVVFPASTGTFHQDQTQLGVVAGYLTETKYAEGRVAFAVNLPFVQQKRLVTVTQGLGILTPASASPALNGGAAVANTKVNEVMQAYLLTQNVETSGMGDAEFSTVWVRHQDRLKVAAGVSLFAPTGSYDKNRGPNPGFGDFYTLRPGVAVTYNLNPKHSDSTWDAGVTVAGRVSYGMNTTNKATDYKSGNFLYAEGGIVKVSGNWAYGMNLLSLQQMSDDTGTGATLGKRYKTYGGGPFVSFKIPGQDAGFNLHYASNFGGENAIVSKVLQLRFVKAW